MKSFIQMLITAALLAAFILLTAKSVTGEPKTKRVYCIAAVYQRISPSEWVGMSNCGTMWKVVVPAKIAVPASIGKAEGQHAEAWYFDEQNGSWNQLAKVPAIGDTLGYADVPVK